MYTQYKIMISLTIIFLLSGCSYSKLDIVHNKENKITTIELDNNKTYIINNSKKVIAKYGHKSIYKVKATKESYISKDICSYIMFQKYMPLGNNQYYNTYAKEDVYSSYINSDCKSEEINGLEFHTCDNNYIVTYESNNSNGYLNEKRFLNIKDKKCFDKIKEIALKKTK